MLPVIHKRFSELQNLWRAEPASMHHEKRSLRQCHRSHRGKNFLPDPFPGVSCVVSQHILFSSPTIISPSVYRYIFGGLLSLQVALILPTRMEESWEG